MYQRTRPESEHEFETKTPLLRIRSLPFIASSPQVKALTNPITPSQRSLIPGSRFNPEGREERAVRPNANYLNLICYTRGTHACWVTASGYECEESQLVNFLSLTQRDSAWRTYPGKSQFALVSLLVVPDAFNAVCRDGLLSLLVLIVCLLRDIQFQFSLDGLLKLSPLRTVYTTRLFRFVSSAFGSGPVRLQQNSLPKRIRTDEISVSLQTTFATTQTRAQLYVLVQVVLNRH